MGSTEKNNRKPKTLQPSTPAWVRGLRTGLKIGAVALGFYLFGSGFVWVVLAFLFCYDFLRGIFSCLVSLIVLIGFFSFLFSLIF